MTIAGVILLRALPVAGPAVFSYDITFGPYGEWTKQASLQVQYHSITDAANLETWRGMSYQTVLTPEDQKTGELIFPYAKAK
jgi:branched-chain amino acid transport system substrate-binding protein